MYNVDRLAPDVYVADSYDNPNQYATILKNDDGTAEASIYSRGNVNPVFKTSGPWEEVSKKLSGFNLEIEEPVYKYWGGPRPGAGRPSTGRRKRTLYITDEEYEKLKEYLEVLRKEE